MFIFGGPGVCFMAWDNYEISLKPDEERELLGTLKILGLKYNIWGLKIRNSRSIRERPNHMAGRNTKFPFSQEMIRFYSISLIRENLN